MSVVPRSVETVHLAAEAIVSAETRLQQTHAPQRKKWISWFSLSCFRSNRPNQRRINHAPSPSQPVSVPIVPVYASANSNPLTQLPFAVPPSSPATSSLQSESASLTLSPAGPNTLTFSPVGPTSIFAIGPYAHETQLVSPPVFSTEPSTAPFTPPPESVHLTTPSSPEVPFAQFLGSFNSSYKKTLSNNSEFTAYQFPPGSPIGQLISPTSGCSSRSSPYRESFFPPIYEPPHIVGPEGIAARKLTPWHTRKDGSLLDGCISAAVPERGQERRVSFELEKEAVDLCVNVKESSVDVETEKIKDEVLDGCQLPVSLKGSKEFMFENSEVNMSSEPVVGSDWWTEDKVTGTSKNQKNWPFLPLLESSVSR